YYINFFIRNLCTFVCKSYGLRQEKKGMTALFDPTVYPSSSVDWIKKLIAYDTTSRESNLGLIHDVQTYLHLQGLETVLTHDPSGRKANLFATIPAADGRRPGGIVPSGPTDVVPAAGP